MELLQHANAIFGLVLALLGLIALIYGGRIVGNKSMIDALRSELTIVRAATAECKTEIAVLRTERDGLKRDIFDHYARQISTLEQLSDARRDNQLLLNEIGILKDRIIKMQKNAIGR